MKPGFETTANTNSSKSRTPPVTKAGSDVNKPALPTQSDKSVKKGNKALSGAVVGKRVPPTPKPPFQTTGTVDTTPSTSTKQRSPLTRNNKGRKLGPALRAHSLEN